MKTAMDVETIAPSRCAYAKSAICLFALGVLALSGCGDPSSVKPQVGLIAFTNLLGQAQQQPIVSLTAGQGVYVMVTLTDDTAQLGADWSLSCASELPPGTPLPPGQVQDLSCGSFNPAHTMSGPIPPYATSSTGYVALYSAPTAVPKGGTVTLYASATADHTRFSSVTLNILP